MLQKYRKQVWLNVFSFAIQNVPKRIIMEDNAKRGILIFKNSNNLGRKKKKISVGHCDYFSEVFI